MRWTCVLTMQQQQQQYFPILPACSLLFQKSSILPHKMDISKTFKATLKAVRMRKKNISEDITEKPLTELGKKQQDSVFKLRSKEIVKNITKLKDVISASRSDYIGVHRFLPGKCMTEAERDQIDKDVQICMKTCSSSISSLKKELGTNNQVSIHRKAVLQLLEDYLKAVCKLYAQQRAIRVKKAVDRKRMSRLNTVQNKENILVKKDLPNLKSPKNIVEIEEPKPKIEEPLSKEEVQMFEDENMKLLNELSGLVDEVKQIEGKVIEISQLQEIFSEKVLDQASQIDKVHETTVSTTENVKDGNENIREAIKNSATFRVWILFFLVMCTFSLLFLDWYNQ
ncbi:syntaxin-18-like [Rhopilema esculentum]|uniref:syntaxin-18-like n=1 Tax=Rhopilema esculentum TaxID=499914 RepID=UPI0031DAB306